VSRLVDSIFDGHGIREISLDAASERGGVLPVRRRSLRKQGEDPRNGQIRTVNDVSNDMFPLLVSFASTLLTLVEISLQILFALLEVLVGIAIFLVLLPVKCLTQMLSWLIPPIGVLWNLFEPLIPGIFLLALVLGAIYIGFSILFYIVGAILANIMDILYVGVFLVALSLALGD